jgi:hypothetical protein
MKIKDHGSDDENEDNDIEMIEDLDVQRDKKGNVLS